MAEYDPRIFWEHHAGRFIGEEHERQANQPHHRVLASWCAQLAPARTVLVGVGLGRDLIGLPGQVIGCDISRSMLLAARERVDVPMLCGDVRMLPLRPVDLVVTAAVLVHVPPEQVDAALVELLRVGRSVALLEPAVGPEGEACEGTWGEWGPNTWRYDYVARLGRLGATVVDHVVTEETRESSYGCVLARASGAAGLCGAPGAQ